MTEQASPPAPKPKRRNKRRARRIPNARPGFEAHSVPDEPNKPPPAVLAAGVTFDGHAVTIAADPPEVDRDQAQARAVPSALSIPKRSHEDITGLTPRQRKWWRHGSGKHRRITDAHKRKFLASLAKFPDVVTAAACTGFTRRSWQFLRARDPEFAAEWDAAIKAGLPVLERAMMVRGFEGTLEPVTGNGQVIAYKRVYSDRMAELIARKYDPQSFSEKLMVAGHVNGTVHHVHHLSPALETLAGRMLGLSADPAASSPALPAPVAAGVGSLLQQLKPQDVASDAPVIDAESEKAGK